MCRAPSAPRGSAPSRTTPLGAGSARRPGGPPRPGPSPPILADLEEILEDLGPVLRVLDLRVELDAEQRPVLRAHRLARAVLARRQVHEVWRERRDLVVVALPHLERLREALEQRVLLLHDDLRLPELRELRRFRVAAKVEGHELVARADPEDGRTDLVQVLAVPAHLIHVEAD